MSESVRQRLNPPGTWFETILSAFVIFVALAFVVFLYLRTGTGHFGSYPLFVRLPSAAGLDVGNDVRVGGVKVGEISQLTLDPQNYSAIAQVSLRDDLLLPVDSIGKIGSTVMGDAYLVIVPGHATRTIGSGGTIGIIPSKHR